MKNVQKGFTLIELMIVVAIIAILAAIAIPQYQTYVVKSQVSRAIAEASDQKVVVEDCLNNGKLTVGSSAGGANLCDPTSTPSDILVNDPQGSVPKAANAGVPQILTPMTDTDGGVTITATFGNHASGTLTTAATTVTLTRNQGGSWSCAFSGLNKYAPASCPGK